MKRDSTVVETFHLVDGNVMFEYLEGSDLPGVFTFNENSMDDDQIKAFAEFGQELCDPNRPVEAVLQVSFSIPEVINHLQNCYEISAKENLYDIDARQKFLGLRKELADAIAKIDKMKFE